jgi:PAS domain S-box-containing protein
MSVLSRRGLYLLFLALSVEVVLALIGSLDEVAAFWNGQRDVSHWIGVASIAGLLLVVLAAGSVGASLHQARRELFSRQQALRAVADTSTDWLWEADTAHRITYRSAGVTALLGYDPTELIGRSTLSLLPASEHAAAEQLLRGAMVDGAGWDAVEMPWQHADGSEVRLLGTAATIKDERGRVVGFRGTRRAVRFAELAERVHFAARARVQGVLDTGALDVALQPIVDLTTGELAGVEALARFRDGRGPDVWFRDAAEAGLALELDRLAVQSALGLFPLIPAGCYLSINATPELVLSGTLQTDLLGRAAELPLDRLVIEITEHARVTSYTDLQALLTPLRERGVRLAVDDTGAGYASLSHVLQLRPSIIKLDRSMVADIAEDRARRSLVTALVLLALDLGASLTGEGIETPAELDTLKLLGVDTGQGYLLARPSTDRRHWRTWWTRIWLTPTRVDGQATPRIESERRT